MSNPFVGEIRLFAGNFAPAGWAFCDGSLLSIAQNEVLFTLIGTTYGGDGAQTFALPDLRGRVPLHAGQGPGLSPVVMGQSGGSEAVTLGPAQLPAHSHPLYGSTTAASATAGTSGLPGATASTPLYGNTPGGPALAPQALASSGGGQAHNNMAPFQAVSYIVSLFGIYPSPN